MSYRRYGQSVNLEFMALEITGEVFEKMINGETVKVNGVYLEIADNSELKFIDIIENKLVKEYGLDVEEEEK